ncbi:MAG: hypothetical protein NUV64_00080 [Parcubacteria group bacterium]|nr:hypothetical protein [Parcubacteria group bacterium]
MDRKKANCFAFVRIYDVSFYFLKNLIVSKYMDITFLAHTLDVLGKLMVGFTAIAVHHRFLKEHKVDGRVLRTMKKEQLVGVLGMIFMIIGYLIRLKIGF